MRVVVSGATGTIGRALVSALLAREEDVVVLSRDEGRAREAFRDRVEAYAWPRPTDGPPPESALAGADAVVHLLGEQIAQRWTDA
ncbi:MAG: NAD(P)H-binding protein, partial [Solirubrobacteraceae bacterium]